MKRILLIGYNYFPEPTGIGKYTGEMIVWLARHGYQCTVITSYPYYPYWKVQEPYVKNRLWYKTERQAFAGGGEIKVYRCPMYVPAQPSGFKRILLDLSFTISAFFLLLKLIPAPRFDDVITVVPSFQFGLLGILYKKLRNARLLYHIHDMQIEAARDLQMIRSRRVINTLFKMEKLIFNQCDAITCVGEGMVRRTQVKTKKVIRHFPNWTDIRQFHPLENRNELKRELGFANADKIILYSGAIGEKQGVDSILYAAQALQKDQRLKFLICGSGPYKEKLHQLATDLALHNVLFCPLQPIEKFNAFLNIADLHLVIQKESACDLVMPSKLTTILAIGGLALVTANKGSGLHSIVEKHRIGLLVDAENQTALTEGIREALETDHTIVKMNARQYAEQFLSIDKIMGSFEQTYIFPGVTRKVQVKPMPTSSLAIANAKDRRPLNRGSKNLQTESQEKKR